MAETRLARELETRTQAERPKQWQRPQTLPDPDPQPGYKFHWMRVSIGDRVDSRNISSKLREGYEIVRLEEQPKYKLLAEKSDRFPEGILIGEVVLCKIPEEFVDQRAAFWQKKAHDEAKSVDEAFLRESDPRMPLFSDKKTKVSFGTGT
jgi:hypothetical protein